MEQMTEDKVEKKQGKDKLHKRSHPIQTATLLKIQIATRANEIMTVVTGRRHFCLFVTFLHLANACN